MGVIFSLGPFDFTAAATLTYASQSLTYNCLGANRFIPSGYTVQGATQLFGLFTVNVNFQIQPKGQDGDFYITITSQIQVGRGFVSSSGLGYYVHCTWCSVLRGYDVAHCRLHR